ncbi:MAG: hypothetical protein WBL53_11525 [Pseudonocardiaceae bacterium]|jgi:hypothetical protein
MTKTTRMASANQREIDVTSADANNPADRLLGGWIARCGRRLPAGSDLYCHPPGYRCGSCARWAW